MPEDRWRVLLPLLLCAITSLGRSAQSEPPLVSYVFPAGGQRGTEVTARFGGCNLYQSPQIFWSGSGVNAPATLVPTARVWFEGPVIPQPSSQVREDYPRDYLASLRLAADAPLGLHPWRVATSQGVTPCWGFVVGDFPEVVEQEVEGNSPTVEVRLPVTLNGRIFPREEIDTWSFSAQVGEVITCHVATSVLGSPLDARVALLDARGNVLAETIPAGEITPALHYQIPETGTYSIQIHDVGFQGLQNHVYRLTLTSGPVLEAIYPLGGHRGAITRLELSGVNLVDTAIDSRLPVTGDEIVFRLPDSTRTFGDVRLELDELDEFLEEKPAGNGAPLENRQHFTVPGILNGRIQVPGEVDVWAFTAQKGVEYDFEVRAARCGSPLDAVIAVCDASGKILQEVDDGNGLQTDARLRWTAPDPGDYQLQIRDRLQSRGGLRFAYRIRTTSSSFPVRADFSLKLAADSVNVEQGQSANIKLQIERSPGFQEPIELLWEGLPAGLTVTSSNTIKADQKEVQVTLKADPGAKVVTVPVRVTGSAKLGDQQIQRAVFMAETLSGPDAVAVKASDSALWVAIALPTPFKFVGIFESKYIPRGGSYVRKYRLERNGFEGPLEVQLADRQGRHLQGVTARPVTVEASQSEFEFTVELPPWMEVGRTCRSTLLVSGQIRDGEGGLHTISFSSNDQHNQMIALVDTGRLTVQLSKATVRVVLGGRVEVPIKIQRSPEVFGPVNVELVTSRPDSGVSAASLLLAPDQLTGTMVLQFGPSPAPISVDSVIIRAVSRDHRGLPVTAETRLTLVPEPSSGAAP